MTDEHKTIALSIVDKFKMDTKHSDYTVIEGDDADQLVLDIAAALAARERAVWLEAAEAYERYVQSRIPKAGDWKPPQPFAAWCRQQAEAVKP